MKVNLRYITDGKFNGSCENCKSENVRLKVGFKRRGFEDTTIVALECSDCKSEWKEEF